MVKKKVVKKTAKKTESPEKKIEKKEDGKFDFSKLNYWMVATVVLAVVLLIVVSSSSLNKISSKKAGQKLIDFANSQGVDLEVLSVKSSGDMYEISANIEGQVGSFYISKDGKYFIPSVIDLSDTSTVAGGSQQQAPQDVPKSDKPKVELFVMSYCPYGTQMEKAMLPAVGVLGDKIDFKVRWVDYIMHGEQERDENLLQYCIEKEQNSKYLPYLQCFLGNADSAGCQKDVGIASGSLDACITATDKEYGIMASWNDRSSWLSGQFAQFNIDRDDNNKYGVQGSPTLVVNGVQASSGRSPAAVLALLCNAFNEAPEECNTSLPTDQASPGFGYGTTPADAAAVQCGF